MKYTMHRDHVIRSVFGHTLAFERGVPQFVPPLLRPEVVAAGGVPEDDTYEDEASKSTEPTDPAERESLIFAAFEEILLKNDRESFTAAGVPHGKTVSKIVGFNVHPKEREAAWVKFTQVKAD